jgi:hypothetical protein
MQALDLRCATHMCLAQRCQLTVSLGDLRLQPEYYRLIPVSAFLKAPREIKFRKVRSHKTLTLTHSHTNAHTHTLTPHTETPSPRAHPSFLAHAVDPALPNAGCLGNGGARRPDSGPTLERW